MANQQNPMGDFGAMAEQTLEQARRAIDEYFSFLLKTISSYPTGGTEFGEKVKNYAESNLAATHEFVKRVVQTKDVQDLARLQTEFMKDQFQKFGQQTQSLGEAFTKAATDAANTVKMPAKKS